MSAPDVTSKEKLCLLCGKRPGLELNAGTVCAPYLRRLRRAPRAAQLRALFLRDQFPDDTENDGGGPHERD